MPSSPSTFAFKPDEKVDQGFLRVLEQLTIQACRITRHSHSMVSDPVHDARVLIKRLRALLWFASPAFSTPEMNRAKSHLREASQLLAAQRDLVVMRSILQMLSRKTRNSCYRKTLVRIARGQDHRQPFPDKTDRSLPQAVAIILATIKQIKKKAKISFDWPSSSDRLAQAFLATKKSGKKALHGDDPAQFHDWRKKAKRLLYQLQLAQADPSKRMAHIIKGIDKLQEKLGDYHDSVIAQDRLRKMLPEKIEPLLLRHSLNLLEKRKNRLRIKVRKIANYIKSK